MQRGREILKEYAEAMEGSPSYDRATKSAKELIEKDIKRSRNESLRDASVNIIKDAYDKHKRGKRR